MGRQDPAWRLLGPGLCAVCAELKVAHRYRAQPLRFKMLKPIHQFSDAVVAYRVRIVGFHSAKHVAKIYARGVANRAS
jgi:hypothetical protein